MVLALILEATPARADELPSPSGPVLLTIDGAIAVTNAEARADFDREMLERLPMVALRTATPWTDGKVEFEGVLLRDLLALVGSRGSTIRATALNDYAVEIPVADFSDEDVILALKQDGRYLTVREKGPLWVVYPLDDNLSDTDKHTKMIWQLRSITVGHDQSAGVSRIRHDGSDHRF